MGQMIFTAVSIGFWGWLWAEKLCQADMIFEGWPKAVRDFLTGKDPAKLEGWRMLVYMPVIGCGKCHAGQLSLWLEIWRCWHGGAFDVRLIVLSIAVAAILERK